MKNKNEYRYVAYDAANGDFEEFKTLKEAEDWLTENDGEGISEEAVSGQNYIAELQYRSVVTKISDREDYCQCEEDCGGDVCGKDSWPCSDEFDWVGKHSYEKIDWEDSHE